MKPKSWYRYSCHLLRWLLKASSKHSGNMLIYKKKLKKYISACSNSLSRYNKSICKDVIKECCSTHYARWWELGWEVQLCGQNYNLSDFLQEQSGWLHVQDNNSSYSICGDAIFQTRIETTWSNAEGSTPYQGSRPPGAANVQTVPYSWSYHSGTASPSHFYKGRQRVWGCFSGQHSAGQRLIELRQTCHWGELRPHAIPNPHLSPGEGNGTPLSAVHQSVPFPSLAAVLLSLSSTTVPSPAASSHSSRAHMCCDAPVPHHRRRAGTREHHLLSSGLWQSCHTAGAPFTCCRATQRTREAKNSSGRENRLSFTEHEETETLLIRHSWFCVQREGSQSPKDPSSLSFTLSAYDQVTLTAFLTHYTRPSIVAQSAFW